MTTKLRHLLRRVPAGAKLPGEYLLAIHRVSRRRSGPRRSQEFAQAKAILRKWIKMQGWSS